MQHTYNKNLHEKIFLLNQINVKITIFRYFKLLLKYLKIVILNVLILSELNSNKKNKMYSLKIRVKKNNLTEKIIGKKILLNKIKNIISSLNFKNISKEVLSAIEHNILLFILRVFLEFIPLFYSRIYLSGFRIFFIITLVSFYLYAFLIYFQT